MIAATRRSFARALVVALCLGSLAPAAALAAPASSSTGSNSAGSPFEQGLPQSSATVPTQTATTPAPVVISTSSADSSTFSGTDALLVALGAVAILAGIAYFIWNDSRHHVRRAAAAGTATGNPGRGSKTPPKSRKLKPAERRRRKRGRAR